MAYNSYIVHGNDDGVIGVYSSWAKATECAMEYCGENAVEDTADYSRGFFFQAEDGIRDSSVTGVQSALPI